MDEIAINFCEMLEREDKKLILIMDLFEKMNLVHERIIYSEIIEKENAYIMGKNENPLLEESKKTVWTDGLPIGSCEFKPFD